MIVAIDRGEQREATSTKSARSSSSGLIHRRQFLGNYLLTVVDFGRVGNLKDGCGVGTDVGPICRSLETTTEQIQNKVAS